MPALLSCLQPSTHGQAVAHHVLQAAEVIARSSTHMAGIVAQQAVFISRVACAAVASASTSGGCTAGLPVHEQATADVMLAAAALPSVFHALLQQLPRGRAGVVHAAVHGVVLAAQRART